MTGLREPNTITVVKISGHELDDAAFLERFALAMAALTAGPAREHLVVVHGGGKEISLLQTRLGIEPVYVEGQRVTDADSLAVVEMVLAGVINTRLTRLLVRAGVDALGMSGVDRGLLTAEKLQHDTVDYGYTGVVTRVSGHALMQLLELGVVPVIAPVSGAADGAYSLNVNADLAAGALAAAVGADRLVFLSNVSAVLRDGVPIAQLSRAEAEHLIAEGVIFGGMIPKVRTALSALDEGVERVLITDLAGLSTGGGTVFTA
jgi:acetylglutamate kinase